MIVQILWGSVRVGGNVGSLLDNILAKHRANLERIIPHWDDVLRLVGSLKLGRVPATGIMRTLQVGDKPTRLAQAIAEIGRIDKTIHMLNYIHDESCRRSTLLQLNLTESRHNLARKRSGTHTEISLCYLTMSV
jgi:TnpA family transposase